MQRALTALAVVGVFVGVLNFFAFLAFSGRLGGDALNGYERDGRYYVSSHGHATEVSAAQWRLSRVHAISVFVTHPLALVSMAYLLFQHVLPSLMYRAPKEEVAAAEQAVRRSGGSLATTSCSGRIGGVNYSGPLIRFTVYPGGIVMKPIFLAPLAVPASEITAVRLRREWWAKGVEIAHTSSHVASPIFLHCPEDHPLVTALRTIAPMGAGRDVR